MRDQYKVTMIDFYKIVLLYQSKVSLLDQCNVIMLDQCEASMLDQCKVIILDQCKVSLLNQCKVIIRAGEPGVFGSLEPERPKEKKQEPEPLSHKSREIGCIFYRAGEPKPGVFVSLGKIVSFYD